jgi:uncharacterized membrane protein HdeD (DUF308 family)
LIVLGTIALGTSVVATLVSVLFIGWLLVIGGAMQAVHAFSVRQWAGFFLRLFAGLLTLIVGLMLVGNPAAGAVSLTLLIAAFFMVGGLFRITAALTHQLPGRAWILLSGAVTLFLGILIWAEWPVSGLWVIGTFVGIDMLFDGWSLVTLGLAVRKLAR